MISEKTNQIIVADVKVEIWSFDCSELVKVFLSLLSIIKTFSGHASPVLDMALGPKSKLLATCAEQDRSIYLWKVSGSSTNAVATLTHDSPLFHTSFAYDSSLLALSEANQIVFWENANAIVASKNSGNKCTSYVSFKDTNDGVNIPILSAAWGSNDPHAEDSPFENIVTARETIAKPKFETLVWNLKL